MPDGTRVSARLGGRDDVDGPERRGGDAGERPVAGLLPCHDMCLRASRALVCESGGVRLGRQGNRRGHRKLGPDPTRDHAGKWAGKIAGDMVKKHKDRDLNVDSGDGDTEEEPSRGE